MSLTVEKTAKVARLARIRLTEDEVQHYASELNHILQWVEQLSEVDTTGVPPMTSVADITLPMRKDEVTDGNKQDDILANAPAAEYGCFAVPKVIE